MSRPTNHETTMDDSSDKNLRRIRREDRKDRLPRGELSFPADEAAADDAAAKEEPEKPLPEFDLEQLSLPDTDSEALQSLAALSDEDVRPPRIIPPEERHPSYRAIMQGDADPAPPPPEVPPPPPRRRTRLGYNLGTLLLLLATGAFVVWLALVWSDPQSRLNPFPPPTPFVEVTATPLGFVAQASPTPNESGQIVVVATQTPAAPPQQATSTAPAQTATASPYPFVLDGEILYIPNENDLGCNWWSIAGRITDQNGEPLEGYRVQVTGEGVDEVVFSGGTLTFGAGSYELPLVGTPQDADFTVQLFSPQEAPLSEPIPVTTRADCEGNVTVVNFVQNR